MPPFFPIAPTGFGFPGVVYEPSRVSRKTQTVVHFSFRGHHLLPLIPPFAPQPDLPVRDSVGLTFQVFISAGEITRQKHRHGKEKSENAR